MISICDIYQMIFNWLIGLTRRVVRLVVSNFHATEEHLQQFELNK